MQRQSRPVLVVCTFRNAETTLPDTLHSLSQQSRPDWACVLVDDGSTDRSRSIAEAAASVDGRFTVIAQSAGRGSALNLGIAQGGGDYVAILDADDVAHPDWLTDACRAAEANEAYAVIGVGSVAFTDVPRLMGANHSLVPPACSDVTLTLCRLNPITHSGTLIRRRVLAAVGGYDPRRLSQFDYDLLVRIALAGGRIGRLDRILVAKRIHRGQKFTRTGHVRYVLRSVAVQSRAIAGLDPRLAHWALAGARIAWGFVPRSLRAAARRRLRRLNPETAD